MPEADFTLDVREPHLVYDDFTAPGLRCVFTPDRVTIEAPDGEVLGERNTPREAFAGHGSETSWDRRTSSRTAGSRSSAATRPDCSAGTTTRPRFSAVRPPPTGSWR